MHRLPPTTRLPACGIAAAQAVGQGAFSIQRAMNDGAPPGAPLS